MGDTLPVFVIKGMVPDKPGIGPDITNVNLNALPL